MPSPLSHPRQYHGAMIRAWFAVATSHDLTYKDRSDVEIEEPPAMAA